MWQALFLLLPFAATCGWWFGRARQSSSADQEAGFRLRRDYFKGLNYLINEQPDKAVDVFVRLLEVDSDTIETHLALGSLFRRRGEVDRAIRIHQNLIARPQLSRQHQLQALLELGEDYFKAGVLDRAERIFLELAAENEEKSTSLNFLLQIYQKEKDWLQAISIAEKLKSLGQPTETLIAQFQCELAELAIVAEHNDEALVYLKKAEFVDPSCARASMVRGRIEIENQQYKEAIKCYQRVVQQEPDFISEIIEPLSKCYYHLQQEDQMVEQFESWLTHYPRISLVLAIADFHRQRQGDKAAIDFVTNQIRRHLSLQGLWYLVSIYIANSVGDTKEKLIILKHFMEKWLDQNPKYQCEHCGFSGNVLYWLCPSCQHWSSIKPVLSLEIG